MTFKKSTYRRTVASLLLWVNGMSLPPIVAAETKDSTPMSAHPAVSSGRVQIASSRVLFPVSKSKVGVELRNAAGLNQIIIKTKAAQPSFIVEEFFNPSRLVLDIDGEELKASQKSDIADLEFVSAIRIGSHPGKVRVVLDLIEGFDISHHAQVVDGAVVVSLTAAPGQQSPAKSEEATSAASQSVSQGNQDIVAAGVAPQLPSTEVDANDVLLTSSSSDAVQANTATEAVPADEIAQVTGLAFTNSSGMNSLKVDVTRGTEFSIRKSAPSEYVLTIKNSAPVGETATEPYFAEAGSKMRSARATVEGADTLVRIFSDPSAYLTASRSGNSLVVTETNNLVQVVDDIRAQIKPEAKEVPAKSTPDIAAELAKELAPADASAKGTKSATAAKNPAGSEGVIASAGKDKKPSKVDGISQDEAPIAPVDSQLAALAGSDSRYTGRLISLDLQETDIDNALRIIAEVSNLNIVASEEVSGKVTLRLLDVPWDQALDVILKSNGLDKVLEGNVMRIAPFEKLRSEREALKQARTAEEELEPLAVKYVRVSYAKASEVKSLVETVLTERGSVAYDERSNQLIVKDVKGGLQNVTELIKKVDLRTPQVLLETQIVEAERNLQRQLGSELGFQYIQSPATGNGTGLNFPSAISVGGSAVPGANNLIGSAFPVAASAAGGSGISMLFDSADGTKSLEARLSQLEQEGRVRIISRPAVATTNNKAAEIKSVKKIRVRLPNGGLSVATGSGAQASGSGAIATETIEAGIILNVTPQASPDYYILLDIKAKSSSFGADSVNEIPSETERSASSTVLVSSGQTFALGGIYKITERDSVDGVPFFKDIPFFGTFFRRSTTSNQDEELLFFITPRIVEGSFDDASMKSAQ